MNVEVSLVLQLLFVTRTLKNVVGIFRDAASCKWGNIVVMVWAVDGISLRWGGLMLWSSQH